MARHARVHPHPWDYPACPRGCSHVFVSGNPGGNSMEPTYRCENCGETFNHTKG